MAQSSLANSKEEAISRGDKYYSTGIPCRQGHVSERLVNSGKCVTCARERDKKRTGTPAKKRNSRLTYLRHREHRCLKVKAYREKNSDLISKRTKEFRERNKDVLSKRWKERYDERKRKMASDRHRKWRVLNKGKRYDYQLEWARENREKVRFAGGKRRAVKLKAIPPWVGEIEMWIMKEIYSLAKERFACTGIEWHVDHIIPLQNPLVCGLHCPDNLRVITREENLSKNNRFIDGI